MVTLDDFIGLLDENDLPKPSEEEMARIREIDDAIQINYSTAPNLHLESWLESLLLKLLDSWEPGKLSNRTFYPTGINLYPLHNDSGLVHYDEILAEHSRRFRLLKESLDGNEDVVRIEDGQLKSFERILEKFNSLNQKGLRRNLRDLSRLRIVARDLIGLERLYDRIFSILSSRGFCLLGRSNFYSLVFEDILEHRRLFYSPFTAISTSWCRHDEKIEEGFVVATEIQLVTQRVRAVMDLNHPFERSRKASYPNLEYQNYVRDLFIKATILDLDERFLKGRLAAWLRRGRSDSKLK